MPGQPGRGLEQERRLADARLATDEDQRARHEPAAQDAVELVDPEAQARQVAVGDRGEADGRATARAGRAGPRPCAARAARGRRVSTRLFQPPQARHWPSQRRNDSAAGLTDVAALRPRHRQAAGRAARLTSASTGVRGSAAVDVETGFGVLVDDDRGARLVFAEQEVLGEDVLDHVLDDPAQRSGAVGDVVAELDDVLLGGLGDLERHLLGAELVAHAGEHQVDDLGDLLDGQRPEHDRRVDAVEELGPEVLLELGRDLVLHQLVRALGAARVRVALAAEAEARVRLELLGAQVRGHDDDAVAEVDPAALGVGQVPVLEDLEEDVEDLRVRLLDLVEEDDA